MHKLSPLFPHRFYSHSSHLQQFIDNIISYLFLILGFSFPFPSLPTPQHPTRHILALLLCAFILCYWWWKYKVRAVWNFCVKKKKKKGIICFAWMQMAWRAWHTWPVREIYPLASTLSSKVKSKIMIQYRCFPITNVKTPHGRCRHSTQVTASTW